ncbi:uncharacterized protein F4812DRAFT_456636 [Daldinia caldariorum]|uniref:uncharacterized protein n=1 Tax=Daldinia caldariorum TaxID=326644 RepID=UPI002007B550|nr:uncharacterized protein F4812DRAFT_456636 [Daldinia caldariorum]KAI1470627.1 hypothetical protein F4812DRAFT_456636 [Daldinia caldariorum]
MFPNTKLSTPDGPPYLPTMAMVGGEPSPAIDDPIAVVLLLLFLLSAAAHMAILRINKKRNLKFVFSGMLFALCLLRSVSLVARMVWASYPKTVDAVIAASVMTQCGSVLIFIINLFLAQRVLRAYHPRLGSHRGTRGVVWFLIVCVMCCLVMAIVATIHSFFTLDPRARLADRAVQLFAGSYLAFLTFLPVPVVGLAAAAQRVRRFRFRPVEKFGAGRWRAKVGLLVFASLVATMGAVFRVGVNFDGRPGSQPAWFHSRACYYGFNFVTDLVVSTAYLLARFDRRFIVPDDALSPGDCSPIVPSMHSTSYSNPISEYAVMGTNEAATTARSPLLATSPGRTRTRTPTPIPTPTPTPIPPSSTPPPQTISPPPSPSSSHSHSHSHRNNNNTATSASASASHTDSSNTAVRTSSSSFERKQPSNQRPHPHPRSLCFSLSLFPPLSHSQPPPQQQQEGQQQRQQQHHYHYHPPFSPSSPKFPKSPKSPKSHKPTPMPFALRTRTRARARRRMRMRIKSEADAYGPDCSNGGSSGGSGMGLFGDGLGLGFLSRYGYGEAAHVQEIIRETPSQSPSPSPSPSLSRIRAPAPAHLGPPILPALDLDLELLSATLLAPEGWGFGVGMGEEEEEEEDDDEVGKGEGEGEGKGEGKGEGEGNNNSNGSSGTSTSASQSSSSNGSSDGSEWNRRNGSGSGSGRTWSPGCPLARARTV